MKQDRTTQIEQIRSHDGIALHGKLDLPNLPSVPKLVIFVNGSGPNTYDNKRDKGDGTQFLFYELFARVFASRGIGFFRYSTRGCYPGDTPGFYCEINEAEYQTYGPNHSVSDVEQWVAHLKENVRLQSAQVYLLGWSEGTMIAPMVALRKRVEISGLLLAGNANDTIEEILDWQERGNSALVFYRQYFDYDRDGTITRAEFEEDRFGLGAFLKVKFEDLDANGDGKLDQSDFAALEADNRKAIFQAIEHWDDDWLKANYPVRLTAKWFHEHRAFPPNRETMPRLDIPIHIFQGVFDSCAPVEGTYAIRERFAALGKTNLTVHLYQDAGHNLNYETYLYKGALSEGLQDIFDVAARL